MQAMMALQAIGYCSIDFAGVRSPQLAINRIATWLL
jgi:hypothetical protein